MIHGAGFSVEGERGVGRGRGNSADRVGVRVTSGGEGAEGVVCGLRRVSGGKAGP